MGKTDISIISVKILALYLIAQGVVAFPGVLVLANMQPHIDIKQEQVILYIAATMLPLIIGLAVLAFSRQIGRFITPADSKSVVPSITTSEILSISMAILGLFLTLKTLPTIVHYLIRPGYVDPATGYTKNIFQNPDFVAYLIAFLFSISLFLGTKFWEKVYYYFREFGLENKTSKNKPNKREPD